MQFVSRGPDIPEELIAAQEQGRVLFVCGAGVSRRAGLPTFKELVEKVYLNLGDAKGWVNHCEEKEAFRRYEWDRVLRYLEKRLAASDTPRNQARRSSFRRAIDESLLLQEANDLSDHHILLKLSRDTEGHRRLLTTNFDTLFERAWKQSEGAAVKSHFGPDLPKPGASRFQGILHLHGRLADNKLRLSSTDLILTSAEFGDAYLRSGWASRYIHDLTRSYVLVFVGYSAEDPPMRYLLDFLDAERERFPESNKIFAFVELGTETKRQAATAKWESRGIHPIFYKKKRSSHALLYESLHEWDRYAEDPTAWRKNCLKAILEKKAEAISVEEMDRCLSLLSHGDAAQLLGELNPDPDWLFTLHDKGAFKKEACHPGLWISKRLDEANMVRACAQLSHLSSEAKVHPSWSLDNYDNTFSPLYRKAWRLLLRVKPNIPPNANDEFSFQWHRRAKSISNGVAGHEECQIISDLYRPRCDVRRPYSLRPEANSSSPKALRDLLDISFRNTGRVSVRDILSAWPTRGYGLLVRTLNRDLMASLDEAEEAEYISPWDHPNHQIPSIAKHSQNEHRDKSFYPIVRAIADLWEETTTHDPSTATILCREWSSSRFLLVQRLYLFSLASSFIPPEEASSALRGLSESTFWSHHARVEIMRLLTTRWNAFSEDDRKVIESRLRNGPTRPTATFSKKDKANWESIREWEVFRRLCRLNQDGRTVSSESQNVLTTFSQKHPDWKSSPGDRDDFSSWMSGVRSIEPHPELLANVPTEQLLPEISRIQQKAPVDERHIWDRFCEVSPNKALGALAAERKKSIRISLWEPFLWNSANKNDPLLHQQTGELLLRTIPIQKLRLMLRAASFWLEKSAKVFPSNLTGDALFFSLWDRLAKAVGRTKEPEIGEINEDRAYDSATRNLGVGLLLRLSGRKPRVGQGLPKEFSNRLKQLLQIPLPAGAGGHIALAEGFAFLGAIAPDWTREHVAPCFKAKAPVSSAMWTAYARGGRFMPPLLFSYLKRDYFAVLEGGELKEDATHRLLQWLILIGLEHQKGKLQEHALSTKEITTILRRCSDETRAHALWIMASEMRQEKKSKGRSVQWNTVVGPFLKAIWPPDANLQTSKTSEQFVEIAVLSKRSFTKAVQTLVPFLMPFRMYQISQIPHDKPIFEEMLSRHPQSWVQLLNAVIDPKKVPPPWDLGEVLPRLREINSSIKHLSAYQRLWAISRAANA